MASVRLSHLLKRGSPNRPRMADYGRLVLEPARRVYGRTHPMAPGVGSALIVNVEAMRPRFVVCYAGINDEGFFLQLWSAGSSVGLSRLEILFELFDLSTVFDILCYPVNEHPAKARCWTYRRSKTGDKALLELSLVLLLIISVAKRHPQLLYFLGLVL